MYGVGGSSMGPCEALGSGAFSLSGIERRHSNGICIHIGTGDGQRGGYGSELPRAVLR